MVAEATAPAAYKNHDSWISLSRHSNSKLLYDKQKWTLSSSPNELKNWISFPETKIISIWLQKKQTNRQEL